MRSGNVSKLQEKYTKTHLHIPISCYSFKQCTRIHIHSVLKIGGSDAGVVVDCKLYELFSWYIKNITLKPLSLHLLLYTLI